MTTQWKMYGVPSLDEKLTAAREWLGPRWIMHPEHKARPYVAQANPLPNLVYRREVVFKERVTTSQVLKWLIA